MNAERRVGIGEERLVRTQQFTHALSSLDDREYLLAALSHVRRLRDEVAIVDRRYQLALEPEVEFVASVTQQLGEAQQRRGEAESLRMHHWERDSYLPFDFHWRRFRVALGVYAKSHVWVGRVPFVRSLPLVELSEITQARKAEEETQQALREAQNMQRRQQGLLREEFEPLQQETQANVERAERTLRELMGTLRVQSREIVSLYASFFPDELADVVVSYSRYHGSDPEEIERLQRAFVRAVENQVGERGGSLNLRRRALVLYGEWLDPSLQTHAPFANPQGRANWEAFIAYDVARECFEKHPKLFPHELRVPRLV